MSIVAYNCIMNFFGSVFVAGVLFWCARLPKKIGWDDSTGPQKIHHGIVPRTGGVAIFVTAFITIISIDQYLLTLLIVAASPVFFAGFIEDLTGSVSAKIRLLASLFTGYLFCWLTGYKITSVDISALDPFLAIPLISFLVTSLAVAAMANSLNIIDGLNGLAGATAILMISTFSVLSLKVADFELQVICLLIVSATMGFLVWNFPFGSVFLGDGGAYFLGALIAGIAVLLPERNADVSPFFIMLTIIYPFYELLRSTVRRIFGKGVSVLEPDDQHLHSLVFKIVSFRVKIVRPLQNSFASLLVLLLPFSCCVWAIKFYDKRMLLIIGICVFILIYEFATKKILSMIQMQ